MGKYIDADKLKAEINRMLDELNPKTGMLGDRPLRAINPKTFPRESELEKVLSLIDTLQQEQSEIDLDKFIKKIEDFQARYSVWATKGAMAFMARMFYQYPNTARQWYDSLPKAIQD